MPEAVTFRLYDTINALGGEWGVSARDVAGMLDSVPSDTSDITLRINSPGGEVPEALAILNQLRSHPARVTAVVDGVAASAASFIAAGVDELVMSPNSELMVHNARGIAMGDDALMQQFTDLLVHMSNNIASIYAEKAGGTAEEWREVMSAETWFSADEAVEAKLADRVAVVPTTAAADAPAPSAVAARFDLSIFNYAGLEKAPAPRIPGPKPPAASADGSVTTTEGGSAVAFSDEQITNLRRKLGVAEDADEATIMAALDESLAERAEPLPATPPATPPAQPQQSTPGTMVIDSSAWEAAQERIKRLERVDAQRRVEERDQVIAQAVRDGKFPEARKEHWVTLWNADAEGTRTVIDGLTKNVIPVNELGHGGTATDAEFDEFSHLFPKGA
jgi:ATP-dependent protease ClpP protease subunit